MSRVSIQQEMRRWKREPAMIARENKHLEEIFAALSNRDLRVILNIVRLVAEIEAKRGPKAAEEAVEAIIQSFSNPADEDHPKSKRSV